MSSRTTVKIIVVFLFVIVIGTPLFYFRWGVYPYTLAKTLFFQSLVEVIFFLWLALAILDKRYRPKKTPFMIALLVFLSVLTLAAIFGVDFMNSFWSTYERALGVVAIYHFAALALVVSSLGREIPWKKICYASIGTAIFIDVLARLQLMNQNLLLIEPIGNRPGATFGNPTFLSDYLLFNIFIAAYLLFDHWRRKDGNVNPGWSLSRPIRWAQGRPESYRGTTGIRGGDDKEGNRNIFLDPRSSLSRTEMRDGDDKKKNRSIFIAIFLLVSLAANLYTIFLAQTRGNILGLGFGFLAMLVVFAVRPPELRFRLLRDRRLYAAVLFLLLALGATFWFTKKNDFWARVPGLARFRNISLSLSAGDQDFAPRLIALRAAWNGFLERPVLGWGPENFNIAFNKFYDPKALEFSYQETRFDKPHNFAMEQLVSGGVPLALAYFSLIGIFIFEATRLRDRLWMGAIIPAAVAYVVSELFVFETIGGLLMLYFLFGVIDAEYKESLMSKEKKDSARRDEKRLVNWKAATGKSYLPAICFGCGLLLAYIMNIPTLKASYDQYRGFSSVVSRRQAEGMDYFREASRAWTPYRWNFGRDFATEVAQVYFYYPGYISDQDVRDGVRAFEDARDAHPLDAYNHYALVDIYNEVSALDPQKYLCEAEKEAEIALTLSPNRQEVYFSLAKTKSLEGSSGIKQCDGKPVEAGNAAALAILKTALDLDPKVSDAHFYYGILKFATSDSVTSSTSAYNEIKEAMRLGRQWKTYYEPRVVADFLADLADAAKDPKYLDEAIDLYKTTLAMEPGDTETEIKLGVAYFEKKDLEGARRELTDAAKKFDFTKSAYYGALKPILDQLGIK